METVYRIHDLIKHTIQSLSIDAQRERINRPWPRSKSVSD